MIKKPENFLEAVNMIKEIDQFIEQGLAEENYEIILNKMTARMVIISEINKMKQNDSIPPEELKQLKEIWENSNKIQKQILEKQKKIKERLAKRRKNVSKVRKFAY
jgi:hypothetical protein